MAPTSNPIMVLRQMVAAYDENPPKTEKQIDAFIARWQKEERADTTRKQRSEMAIHVAVNSINRREIETIAETKTFRDEQRERRKQGYVSGGQKGGVLSADKKRKQKPFAKPTKLVEKTVLKRNVIW